MNVRYLAIAALIPLLATPLASAGPTLPPLVGFCVDGVRDCWGSDFACVGFSYQVPQCVEDPSLVCTETCNPCMWLQCEPASGPEPMCMYYYYEVDLGPVRYVQRDSCHSELYVLGERVK